MAKKQTRPATKKAVQNTDSMVMDEPIVQEKPTKQKNTFQGNDGRNYDLSWIIKG